MNCRKYRYLNVPSLLAIKSQNVTLILFINVYIGGDIFVLSPLNLIFLAIPALLKSDKFTTIDVLLRSGEFPNFSGISRDSLFDKLCEICDSKGLALGVWINHCYFSYLWITSTSSE